MAFSTCQAAAGRLVLAHATGGFMPQRVMLVQAGARIPEGVRLVVSVVSTAAVPRGAVARRMAAAGDGATGDEGTAEEAKVYRIMELQGINARDLLSQIEPPPHLVERIQKMELKVNELVSSANSRKLEKKECAMAMIHLAYGIVDLAYKCCPVASMNPPPKEKTFVDLCLGRDLEDEEEIRAVSMLFGKGMESIPLDLFEAVVGESDAEDMKAVVLAMNYAVYATARYVYSH